MINFRKPSEARRFLKAQPYNKKFLDMAEECNLDDRTLEYMWNCICCRDWKRLARHYYGNVKRKSKIISSKSITRS